MVEPAKFIWDEEKGLATCILNYDNQVFYGIATCHPEDRDMISEKTGCNLAYRRAFIGAMRYRRDSELKPALKALKQLYYSMNMSSHFSEKSYEARMLKRQIIQHEEDILLTKQMITRAQQDLRSLIAEKEKFYQHIRHNRKGEID